MFLFLRGKVYHFEYYDESENRLRRISTKCRKKNEAIKFLTDFKQNLKSKPKTNSLLLSEFKKIYLKHIEITCSNNYYESVRITFNLLEREFNNIPLSRISPSQLENYFIETYKRTKYGAKLYSNTLKCAFQKAVQWNYLIDNPLNKFKLPKLPEKANLYISETEFSSILDKADNETLKDLYLFAYNTGMRLSEITNLKWSSVSLNEGIIKVENTETFTTKSKKARIIPINSILLEVLQRSLPKVMDITKDIYVFNKDGVKFNNDYVSKQFKVAVREAKLNDDYHFHLLRASFISNLAKRNVPLSAIQKLAGHENIRITEKYYLSVQDESLIEAMKTLDEGRIKKVSAE